MLKLLWGAVLLAQSALLIVTPTVESIAKRPRVRVYGGRANTIDCGDPGQRADSDCRVNVSTYPEARDSGSRKSFITSREGDFSSFHAPMVYLSQSDKYNKENCTNAISEVYLNIAFSHMLQNDSQLPRNVSRSKSYIENLLDFGQFNDSVRTRFAWQKSF